MWSDVSLVYLILLVPSCWIRPLTIPICQNLDVFSDIPTNEDTHLISIRINQGLLTFVLNVTRIFPRPTCNIDLMKQITVTQNYQKQGILYQMLLNATIPHELLPECNLKVVCKIGIRNVAVFEKTFADCKSTGYDKISLPLSVTILLAGLAVLAIASLARISYGCLKRRACKQSNKFQMIDRKKDINMKNTVNDNKSVESSDEGNNPLLDNSDSERIKSHVDIVRRSWFPIVNLHETQPPQSFESKQLLQKVQPSDERTEVSIAKHETNKKERNQTEINRMTAHNSSIVLDRRNTKTGIILGNTELSNNTTTEEHAKSITGDPVLKRSFTICRTENGTNEAITDVRVVVQINNTKSANPELCTISSNNNSIEDQTKETIASPTVLISKTEKENIKSVLHGDVVHKSDFKHNEKLAKRRPERSKVKLNNLEDLEANRKSKGQDIHT